MTSKALSPTNFERQNVNLVLQILSEYTIQGLLTLGKQKCLPNFAEVAESINIFYICWTIMNVKTPNKGCWLRNKYYNPLRLNEENLRFLSVFCDWLESWNSISGKNGKLTKETFTVLHHTTYAFLELTKYGIELKMLYILPDKFQTDHLEEGFGPYCQLSGDHYNISIQVFKCEKKLSVLKLNLPFNQQYINDWLESQSGNSPLLPSAEIGNKKIFGQRSW